MLEPGSPIPDVQVWTGVDPPRNLLDVVGTEAVLLCFYLWDWSPT